MTQGLREILEESGKLVATLFQGQMGGFTKKKGNEINPPKLEREEVCTPVGFCGVIDLPFVCTGGGGRGAGGCARTGDDIPQGVVFAAVFVPHGEVGINRVTGQRMGLRLGLMTTKRYWLYGYFVVLFCVVLFSYLFFFHAYHPFQRCTDRIVR